VDIGSQTVGEAYGTGNLEYSAAAIARALRTRRLGRPVVFFERVGSTNDVAHRQALAGAPEGLLVVADEQTAGRGRMGRPWLALKGTSLLFSLLLRPLLQPAHAAQLTMCLGLGALEGVEIVAGPRPALKWPNDLLLGGRKLGGMLAELRTAEGQIDYAVLGLGINVNVKLEEPRWTSLSAVLGRAVDRVELLAEIVARCEVWYERVFAAQAEVGNRKAETGARKPQGGEQIHAAWAARLDTLGRLITVSTSAGELRGRAVGVSEQGALIVEKEDGDKQLIWGGDVTVVEVA
jgi:BirA family biotin operon repressor/biotin-[acetyl-CoA-carboxylase] ligase